MLYFHIAVGKGGFFIRCFKDILKKILFPGWGWVILFTLLGGGSLALTFLVFGGQPGSETAEHPKNRTEICEKKQLDFSRRI